MSICLSGIYDYPIFTPGQLHPGSRRARYSGGSSDPLTLCFALDAGIGRPALPSGQGTPEIIWKEPGGLEERLANSLPWLLPARCGLTGGRALPEATAPVRPLDGWVTTPSPWPALESCNVLTDVP